jgi:hypothetical protein
MIREDHSGTCGMLNQLAIRLGYIHVVVHKCTARSTVTAQKRESIIALFMGQLPTCQQDTQEIPEYQFQIMRLLRSLVWAILVVVTMLEGENGQKFLRVLIRLPLWLHQFKVQFHFEWNFQVSLKLIKLFLKVIFYGFRRFSTFDSYRRCLGCGLRYKYIFGWHLRERVDRFSSASRFIAILVFVCGKNKQNENTFYGYISFKAVICMDIFMYIMVVFKLRYKVSHFHLVPSWLVYTT